MGDCYLVRRSGVALAIQVVRSLERPVAPVENLIWFKTDIQNGEWMMSPTAPTESQKTQGLIWVEPNDGSIEIDILKRNTVMTHLGQARLYFTQDGKMVSTRLDGEIYQNGEWHVFSTYRTYIYNKGDEHIDLTGGWENQAVSGWADGWFQKNASELSGGAYNDHSAMFVTTKKPIRMSWYKALCFNFTWVRNNWSGGLLKNRIPSTSDLATYAVKNSGKGVLRVDVSKINDLMYPTLYAYRGSEAQKGFTVDQIWLES